MPRLPASVTEPTHEYKSIHLELPPLLYKRNKYDVQSWIAEVKMTLDHFVDDLVSVSEGATYVNIGGTEGCNGSCDRFCYDEHRVNTSIAVSIQYLRDPTDEEIEARTEIYQKSLEDKKLRRKEVAAANKEALKKKVKANKAQVLKILEELDNE